MRFRYLLAATILSCFATSPALSGAWAEPPIYTGAFSDIAVQGHDPVAYFMEGKPVKGSKTFEAEWNGATFRFASAENRDLFLADPEKYAPQYGGYCAWAIADGKFAKGDADHWRIVDGKLYLNYNAKIQKKWDADTSGFIDRADDIWPTLDKD